MGLLLSFSVDVCRCFCDVDGDGFLGLSPCFLAPRLPYLPMQMATLRQGLRIEMGVCRMVQWQPGCPFDDFSALVEGGGTSGTPSPTIINLVVIRAGRRGQCRTPYGWYVAGCTIVPGCIHCFSWYCGTVMTVPYIWDGCVTGPVVFPAIVEGGRMPGTPERRFVMYVASRRRSARILP